MFSSNQSNLLERVGAESVRCAEDERSIWRASTAPSMSSLQTECEALFASGLNRFRWRVHGLAFDKAGNLFVAEVRSGRVTAIYKFTPAGVRTTFASGLTYPCALAFDSAGNLFVAE